MFCGVRKPEAPPPTASGSPPHKQRRKEGGEAEPQTKPAVKTTPKRNAPGGGGVVLQHGGPADGGRVLRFQVEQRRNGTYVSLQPSDQDRRLLCAPRSPAPPLALRLAEAAAGCGQGVAGGAGR